MLVNFYSLGIKQHFDWIIYKNKYQNHIDRFGVLGKFIQVNHSIMNENAVDEQKVLSTRNTTTQFTSLLLNVICVRIVVVLLLTNRMH